MDFQNVNLLNVHMNLISGNLFPMTTDNSRFPIAWRIYSAVIWSITVIVIIAFFYGFMMVSKEKVIKDGMVGIVYVVEIFFMVLCIYMNRDLVVQLIQNMNNILRVQDGTMRCIVTASLKLMNSPFRFYWMSCVTTSIIWISMPLTMIFTRDSFFYEDYRLPFAISKQPFSGEIFLLGCILLVLFGGGYLMVKKAAVDIYVLNFVILLTAQYRYIAVKLEEIFREENSHDERDNSENKNHPEIDSWAETKIKAICRHHNTVIHMSGLLKKLLSLNFSLLYLISILRFSFVGVMLSNTKLLKTIVERVAMIFFACGELIQFYMMCSYVQKLLDASTEMTDKAFHKNWFQSRPSIKRTFMSMILANNLKCRLATFEKFNISLSSFMTIMNQAYSITLLCIKIVNNSNGTNKF